MEGMGDLVSEKMNFKRLTKVLSCLSLLTELLALVSPYWLEVGIPGFETSLGLWNICLNWFCTKLPMGMVPFEVTKALMTLSTLLGFIAVCSVLTSFHTFRKYRLAAVMNLLTGIVALVSVLVFGASFSVSSLTDHPEMKAQHGWSFYVGCLASFLFLLSALVSAITHVQCHETPTHSLSEMALQQRGLRPGSTALPPGSTARLQQDQAGLELPQPV